MGVDVQNPNHSIRYLKSLSSSSSKINRESMKLLDSVSNLILEKKATDLNEKERKKLLENLEKMILSDSKHSLIEKKYAQLAKIQLIRCLEFLFNPSPNHRDQLMAENLKSLSTVFGEEYKIVYWGHDGHVRKNEGGTGYFLEKIVDNKVFSLSLQALRGQHKAYGIFDGKLTWGNSTLIELPNGTLEKLIYNIANKQDAYIIFDELPNGLVHEMNIWRPVRSIGATVTDLGLNSWKIDGNVYNGIVVFESTSSIQNPK